MASFTHTRASVVVFGPGVHVAYCYMPLLFVNRRFLTGVARGDRGRSEEYGQSVPMSPAHGQPSSWQPTWLTRRNCQHLHLVQHTQPKGVPVRHCARPRSETEYYLPTTSTTKVPGKMGARGFGVVSDGAGLSPNCAAARNTRCDEVSTAKVRAPS
jgi:hypothetical protein